MVKHIDVQLPIEITNLLTLHEDELSRKVQELVILELYREHKISAGKAAELLSMSKAAFIAVSSSLGVPHIDYSLENVNQDFSNIMNLIDADEDHI